MKDFSHFLIVTIIVATLTDYGICQLDLEWSLKTPEGENHRFRDIAVNVSDKKLYISDTYTDVVYIYSTKDPSEPIGSITDHSWQGWPGPYGIGISQDQKVYIAVMLLEDNDNKLINDFSLWRCTPSGENLRRVCSLPDLPRGIKVMGGGVNTVIYVSGSGGNVIRCKPVKYPHRFEAEILFGLNVINQQDILVTEDENTIYTSYWSVYTPFGSTIVKWNLISGSWQLDENFAIAQPLRGNYPALDFNRGQDWLYVFQIGIYGNNSHIYKVDPLTGAEVSSVFVAPSAVLSDGASGAGGLDITKKGNIYFAGAFGMQNSHIQSVYGMIRDTTYQELTGIQITDQHDAVEGMMDSNTLYLAQNFPNPFNPLTKISFYIPNSNFVSLKVYNAIGKEVSILVNDFLSHGSHSYYFEGKNLASGIYYYQLVAGEFRKVKKMILLR